MPSSTKSTYHSSSTQQPIRLFILLLTLIQIIFITLSTAFITPPTTYSPKLPSTSHLNLNRILLAPSEVFEPSSSSGGNYIILPSTDSRNQHINNFILKDKQPNSTTPIRCAILNERLCDGFVSVINETTANNTKKQKVLPSVKITLPPPPPPHQSHRKESAAAPKITVLLSLPRPILLPRILKSLSQLGICHVILLNGIGVRREYWGGSMLTKLLSSENDDVKDNMLKCYNGDLRTVTMNELQNDKLLKPMIDGLSQSGILYKMPTISTLKSVRNLRSFFDETIGKEFNKEEWIRIVAHPRDVDSVESKSLNDIINNNENKRAVEGGRKRNVLLAIGPEPGWDDEFEIKKKFIERGFEVCKLIGLGALSTEVASVLLIGEVRGLLSC